MPTGLKLLMEPGRFIVGNCGDAAHARAVPEAQRRAKEFIVTDAGMTELIRPSHYNAYHRIEAVAAPAGS